MRVFRPAVALTLVSLCSCVGPSDPSQEQIGAASDELRICAAGATVPGIDVSHWDATIDWPRVAASGVAFTFMKATQGTTYTDPTFARNWSESRSAGVLRGAYHFFCPKMNGTDQANQFLSVMGTMEPDDLPPVLDVETCPTATCGSACDWSGVSCATIALNIQRFVDRVGAVTGRTPMIYSGVGTWDGAVCSSTDFSDLPLWVANYGVMCPSVPTAWGNWTFWQTGDAGSVPGITTAVDMNVFNGDMAALRAFIGSATPTPRCGDGTCDATETCTSCAGDCGTCPPVARCGDGTCDASETCTSCAGDCGACPPVSMCGDHICDYTETCSSCATDCGRCAVPGDDAGAIVRPDAGVSETSDSGALDPVIRRPASGTLSSSCGCSAPGTSSRSGASALATVGALGLLVLARRRRQRRSLR